VGSWIYFVSFLFVLGPRKEGQEEMKTWSSGLGENVGKIFLSPIQRIQKAVVRMFAYSLSSSFHLRMPFI
jgi:hypothetical protein